MLNAFTFPKARYLDLRKGALGFRWGAVLRFPLKACPAKPGMDDLKP